MQKSEIRGIIVPILTPMHKDEKLNLEELRRQVDRMIGAGIHGIFCLGTNGEAFALSDEEKRQVIRTTVEQAAGRVPVYAGTGCVTTRDTLELSLYAQEVGADALSIITPYFAASSQEQLYRHYETIANAVRIPIIVYNIPARTGASVSPKLWKKMTKLERIAGIKDSSGNFDNMLQYLRNSQGTECAVLSGNDSLILWNLYAGGKGGIAGCANVYPETLVGIYDAFQTGDLEKAAAFQNSLATFREVFQYGNPNTVVKMAAAYLGNDVGPCRKPFDGLSEEGVKTLRQVLEQNRANGMK